MNFLVLFLATICIISFLIYSFFESRAQHLTQLNNLQTELLGLQLKNNSLEAELLISKKELASYKSNVIFGSIEYVQGWFENLSWTPFTANLVLYLGCVLTSYYILGWIIPGLPGIKESLAFYNVAKQKIAFTAAFLNSGKSPNTDLEIVLDKVESLEKVLEVINANFIINNQALDKSIRAMNEIGHKGLPIPQAQMDFLTESLQHAADTAAEIAARSTIPHLNRPGFQFSAEQMRHMMSTPVADTISPVANSAFNMTEAVETGISIFKSIS